MTFRQGTRVTWKGRLATVAYVRLQPPEYAEPMAYSIELDDQLGRLNYVGTIVPAAEVCAVVMPTQTQKAR
jgi:hypothetical protein